MNTAAKVPANYACPLCPDHKDDVFYESKVTGVPICEGCMIEISHFVEEDERPDDFVLDRLEAVTGLTFPEYKRIVLQEMVEEFEWKLQPENALREAQPGMKLAGMSFEDVKQGWTDLIDRYKKEIERLGD